MRILDRLFRKRQRPKSPDDVTVKLITTKNLSEEQRNVIIDLLKQSVFLGLENGKIQLKITYYTGINEEVVVLNRTINSIEVIF